MPAFEINNIEITGFRVDNTIFFRHYFENNEVFTELRTFCNHDKYRFEVPSGVLDTVQQILDTYYHRLRVVENLDPYCAIVGMETDYSDILKTSVLTKERSGYLILLQRDELSVEQEINHGRHGSQTDP